MIDDTFAGWQTPAVAPPAQQIPAGTTRRLPYSKGKRAGYGLLWAGWTALLTVAGFAELFGGQDDPASKTYCLTDYSFGNGG
jgi:hypothetical protein